LTPTNVQYVRLRAKFHEFEKLSMEVGKMRGKVELGFVSYPAMELCMFYGLVEVKT
jgi:hypothetical protein